MIFWRKIASTYLLYFIKVGLVIFLMAYFENLAEYAKYHGTMLIIISEGIIFNQLLSIPGMSVQLALGSIPLSRFFKVSNIVIIVFVNLTYGLSLYLLQTLFWERWIYLNIILLGMILVGNWVSNSRLAYSFRVYNVPLLRILTYLMVFAGLNLAYLFMPYIIGFLIILAYGLFAFKQFYIRDKYQFVVIDLMQYD